MHHLSSNSLRPDDLYKQLMWLLAQNKLLDAECYGLFLKFYTELIPQRFVIYVFVCL